MIRDLFRAAAVIIGDSIEGWATRRSREDLIDIINEQLATITELEDELDLMTAERDTYREAFAELLENPERAREVAQMVDQGEDDDGWEEDDSGFKSQEVTPKNPSCCDFCFRPLAHCRCVRW